MVDQQSVSRLCGICEAPNRPCICSSCCRKLIASDRSTYATLVTRRDALAISVRDALHSKEDAQQQQHQLQQLLDSAARARAAADAMDAQLQQVELRVQSLRTASTARAAAIHDANSALEHQRAAFSHTLPDATRSRQLEYRILAEQLARSQQATIKTLLAVLPITITALRNRPLSPQHLTDGAVAPLPCVAACGVRLPEMWDVLGETDTPGGGGQGGQEWGTALGCAALTLDLLATYLRAPQLHHLAFQGSTSHVWAPKTFAHRRAPGHSGALPLYPPTTAAASSPGGEASGSALPRGIQRLSRATSNRAATRGEFARAVQLLQRSAGLLVAHTLRGGAGSLPPDWSPFAWLAGLCDQLTADDPLMGAHMLGPSAQLGPPAMQVPAGTPTDMGMAMMPLSCSFDEDEEEVMDGWDVVQRPSLPPPPCQSDEVEHWSRAMFRDNNEPPTPTPSRLASVQVPAVLARPVSAPGWAQGDVRRQVGGRVSIRNVARTFHSTRAVGTVGAPVAASVYDQAGEASTLLLATGRGGSQRKLYNTGED